MDADISPFPTIYPDFQSFRPCGAFFAASYPANTVLWPPLGGEIATEQEYDDAEQRHVREGTPDFLGHWRSFSAFSPLGFPSSTTLMCDTYRSETSFVYSFPSGRGR